MYLFHRYIHFVKYSYSFFFLAPSLKMNLAKHRKVFNTVTTGLLADLYTPANQNNPRPRRTSRPIDIPSRLPYI
jgi:hypothetical protein